METMQIDPAYQYMAIAGLIIAGAAIFLKAGKWWGALPIAAAVYWLFQMLKGY
jgi:hypothetical protein